MNNDDFLIEFHNDVITEVLKHIKSSAFLAMQDVKIDIDKDQTVPFRDGTLDDSAHVKLIDDSAELHYSTPYAAKQYYEPMNHYTGQHANATDHWMDPYIPGTGKKGTFIEQKINKHLKDRL